MKIIKEYKDYLLVESVGEYFNTRYEVLKKDFYYTNEQEKKTTYILCGHSTNLKRAEEIFNNRIDIYNKAVI